MLVPAILLLSSCQLSAQANLSLLIDSLYKAGICDRKGYCIPNLNGLPPPKGAEISQQRVFDYRLRTRFQDSTTTDRAEVDGNRRWEMKLRLPIILKDKFKLLMGFSYTVEEFEFHEPGILTNEFQQNLQDKPLRRVRTTLYGARPFKGNKYLLSRASFSLNGDFNGDKLSSYFKFAIAGIYGIKSSATKSWGIGLSYSYTFGELAIYPIFAYNKQFTRKLGVELLLPVSAKFRYMPSSKDVFYYTTRLQGDNYNIHLNQLSDETLFLGKSDLLNQITYEREIYDFIWFSLSAGLRSNINFDLSDRDQFTENRDPKIENTIGTALFYQFGIFLVPPKKWTKNK